METVIRKWGNSPALRLPNARSSRRPAIVSSRKSNSRFRAGRIVIRADREGRVRSGRTGRGITSDKLHDEVSFGEPLGKEAL